MVIDARLKSKSKANLFARNIVTSWKKSAFKAIGIDTPIEHDERYRQADEYLRVLYKLWEGSWSDDAIIKDVANDA
jgi:alkanesulfonate monooxygenase SsuD/methylene tetrahydromethanopterin reductase-like flavin-dependent oxidoreductase (luciferase family)